MKSASDPSSPDDPQATRKSARRRIFAVLAAGIPTLLGLALVIGVLAVQQRLVWDPDAGWFRFQSPPLYLFEPDHQLTGHRYIYDSLLGWRNIPRWEATTYGHQLTINSKGLRDREHPFKKPPGTRRILVLGDSFAWGYGVGDDESFPVKLEELLAARSSAWEVINTGVSGWGTDQEFLYLTHEGFRYEPDIVILAMFLVNDPINNSSSMQYGLHKPVFLTTDLQLGNTPVPKPQSGAPVLESQAEELEITFYILQAMQQACEQQGCELVIMKFGAYMRPDPEFTSKDQLFQLLIKTRLPKASLLNLDQQFVQRGATWQMLVEGMEDNHWNPRGHNLAAQILVQYLSESGLLD